MCPPCAQGGDVENKPASFPVVMIGILCITLAICLAIRFAFMHTNAQWPVATKVFLPLIVFVVGLGIILKARWSTR